MIFFCDFHFLRHFRPPGFCGFLDAPIEPPIKLEEGMTGGGYSPHHHPALETLLAIDPGPVNDTGRDR